jgi:hypothetical protein
LQGKKPLIVDESIAVDRIGSTESVAAAEAQTSSPPRTQKTASRFDRRALSDGGRDRD